MIRYPYFTVFHIINGFYHSFSIYLENTDKTGKKMKQLSSPKSSLVANIWAHSPLPAFSSFFLSSK